jgi:hypothetical protein
MSLPLRIARAVPPRAVRLAAAVAIAVASGAAKGAACSEVRVYSAFEGRLQDNREHALEVICRVQDDPDARVFRLRPSTSTQGSGHRWQLSMRDRESKDGWIQLALPGAVPAITRESAKLSYRNANGGRQVDLEAGPSASRLDVWVDYGLDVNIEADLDPRVDRLNTHGPITALACTIGPVEPD